MGDPARYEDAHHLRPLAWPELPIVIELHREPNHPTWLTPPATSELLQLTRPSVTGVAGLSAPVPAAHALLLAAHSWAHAPLRRLLDLIDVMVVLEGEDDRRHARELALPVGARPGVADDDRRGRCAVRTFRLGAGLADLGSPSGCGA